VDSAVEAMLAELLDAEDEPEDEGESGAP
jgi:hypothetical protein